LQNDVDRFESHLAARCVDVQAALNDIAAVLEDPTRLRNNDGLEAAQLKEFNAENYPPIAVEVVALNELEEEARTSAEATAQASDTISASDLDVLAPDPNVDVDEGVDINLDDGLAVQTGEIDPADVSAAADMASPEDMTMTADVGPAPETASPDEMATMADMETTAEVEVQAAVEEVADLDEVAAEIAAEMANDGDPQLGVDTQVIPPPPVPGPDDDSTAAANGEVPADGGELGDPFLDELRRVTTEDPSQDDAISEFFEEKQDRGSGGWFGRRR